MDIDKRGITSITEKNRRHIIEQRCDPRKVMLFCNLSEGMISNILTVSKILKFDKGKKIFDQGERQLHMYFVLFGIVSAIRNLKHGEIDVIDFFSDGELINYGSLFSEENYCAISEKSNTYILQISKENFMHILRENPEFSLHYIKYISALGQLNAERICSLKSDKLLSKNRLAHDIIYLRKKHGRPNIIKYGWITQKYLGSFTGISREHIARLYKTTYRENGVMGTGQKTNIDILLQNIGCLTNDPDYLT